MLRSDLGHGGSSLQLTSEGGAVIDLFERLASHLLAHRRSDVRRVADHQTLEFFWEKLPKIFHLFVFHQETSKNKEFFFQQWYFF